MCLAVAFYVLIGLTEPVCKCTAVCVCVCVCVCVWSLCLCVCVCVCAHARSSVMSQESNMNDWHGVSSGWWWGNKPSLWPATYLLATWPTTHSHLAKGYVPCTQTAAHGAALFSYVWRQLVRPFRLKLNFWDLRCFYRIPSAHNLSVHVMYPHALRTTTWSVGACIGAMEFETFFCRNEYSSMEETITAWNSIHFCVGSIICHRLSASVWFTFLVWKVHTEIIYLLEKCTLKMREFQSGSTKGISFCFSSPRIIFFLEKKDDIDDF